MIVKCLNCGYEFETNEIKDDELGLHCICEKCGASFDINETPIDNFQENIKNEWRQ